MSLRKPIIKVTRECLSCKGSGEKIINKRIRKTDDFFIRDKIIGQYIDIIINCPKCHGSGRVDIKQNDPKFKKYYQKDLEQRVDDLTTEYRNAKAEAFNIGEELRKYCKELDKVVNK